eukprot:CAMPEP_0182595796 /NCGR_PEP_ID=MMETSP1324-20130603/82970_1 /TAXON_ID=236786 /ORGANISM="Florenciella sp., Strain RCC1587" /LENGTH=34 /DNA_ID= /DNA_START= /DNA_END= /DNA_ORIENTATION=
MTYSHVALPLQKLQYAWSSQPCDEVVSSCARSIV